MRRTRQQGIEEQLRVRIIPAHAGNSHVGLYGSLVRPDHPRACGELIRCVDDRGGQPGSSPRMRGTRFLLPCCVEPPRIIPAHAGNSRAPRGTTRSATDHPRACGELLAASHQCVPRTGSSPRMRGTRPLCLREHEIRRIIPAHAGNSPALPPRARDTPDHPRACGELALILALVSLMSGSSPRMRGTLRLRRQRDGRARIIPAHAGNSPLRVASGRLRSDHPRACGELTRDLCQRCEDVGSSPRMRGTLSQERDGPGRQRIIPAHAGNSYE